MEDQGKSKPESQGGLSSMTEITDALPKVTPSVPPSMQVYASPIPQSQYQQSPPTIPYQQPHPTGQSPPIYGAGPDNQTYYSYSQGQRQLDPSLTGYQYGAQPVGYKNSPTISPQRPMQQGQGQAYNLPRYQYPQQQYPQQQYPQQLGRPLSI